MTALETLQYYFTFPFVRYALVVGVLIALCASLFGVTSILTLTQAEVWLCVVLSAAVIALFVVFYNRIFAVTFDEAFATATGLPSGRYSLLIAVVIAVISILAGTPVGSTIVAVDLGVFALFALLGALTGRTA